jgi:hypothetical protein
MRDLSNFERGQIFGERLAGASVTKIHTAGTIQSWFEEHKSKLQRLPWPAQSPDLNIIEPV